MVVMVMVMSIVADVESGRATLQLVFAPGKGHSTLELQCNLLFR